MEHLEDQLREINEQLQSINQKLDKITDDLNQKQKIKLSPFSNILPNILKGIIIVVLLILIFSALPLLKFALS